MDDASATTEPPARQVGLAALRDAWHSLLDRAATEDPTSDAFRAEWKELEAAITNDIGWVMMVRSLRPGRPGDSEGITELRRLKDDVRDSRLRLEDRALAEAQMRTQREMADASNALAATMTRWTKVLAVATVVLALATIGLIWATAAA